MLVCLILVVGLGGCQVLPDWVIVAAPTAAPSGTVLFSDDFSQVPNGWGVSESANAAVAYERDGLRILVGQPGKDAWSVAGRKFADVDLAVSVRRLSGPVNNMIGLICRYQDSSNFYLAFVSTDGYYGIARIEQDSFHLISAKELQYSSFLTGLDAEFQLQALCSRDLLALFANGQPLAQVRDSTFGMGDVGVFAGSYDQPGVDIVFDNFTVKQP
ncbi:MAG TPA: hypothetical protein PJ988_00320 [Anaerolinea sp.]|nr:hypothetical protein [Anaerolinea sp.]